MNCNEVKNLLFEACDLNEIMADNQLQAHINECSKCRAALKFEQKLREGFGSIAQQGPPADIAARILAISKPEQCPAKNATWWQAIMESLTQISLKTAAISCLVGFIVAMFAFRQGAPVVSQQDFARATEEINIEIATEAEAPPATEPKVSKTATKAKTEKVVELFEDAEIIPGAESSFSIHDETESLVSNHSNNENTFAMARSRAAAPSMPAKDSFKAESSPQILFSKIAETSSEESVKKIADPRASELTKLLKEAGISLKPGPLDLSLLAMRGLISSEKLISLRPAPGSHWFVEDHDGVTKIILKNNK